MSPVTSFVAELIRAANEIDKLSNAEIRQLIRNSVVIIQDMRDLVGIPTAGTRYDAMLDLQTVSVSLERRQKADIVKALLDAADMIRTLRVVMHSGTRITTKPG